MRAGAGLAAAAAAVVKAASTDRNGEADPSGEPHGTVMIVDDDPAVLETMELALSCQGHHVVTAQSGRAAIETARCTDVDLVLTDFRMGDMDGLETMRAIKALKPATRVMIVTGFASAEMEDELRRSGAVAIVTKPFGLDDLYAAVRRALVS